MSMSISVNQFYSALISIYQRLSVLISVNHCKSVLISLSSGDVFPNTFLHLAVYGYNINGAILPWCSIYIWKVRLFFDLTLRSVHLSLLAVKVLENGSGCSGFANNRHKVGQIQARCNSWPETKPFTAVEKAEKLSRQTFDWSSVEFVFLSFCQSSRRLQL